MHDFSNPQCAPVCELCEELPHNKTSSASSLIPKASELSPRFSPFHDSWQKVCVEHTEARTLNPCDACPHCDDVCVDHKCPDCTPKRERIRIKRQRAVASYSMCEIRRHNSEFDAWLVAHGVVYDATPFVALHPAGKDPIIKRAGGDCTIDFDFHSVNARKKAWKSLEIGRLKRCPKDPQYRDTNCNIM